MIALFFEIKVPNEMKEYSPGKCRWKKQKYEIAATSRHTILTNYARTLTKCFG
jgi:hypothetical protein